MISRSTLMTLIGGGIGYAILGPIGAIIGAIGGNSLDRAIKENTQDHDEHQTTAVDFNISFTILAAHITKIDGRIDPREVAHVQNFFTHKFPFKAQQYIELYHEVLEQHIYVSEVCAQLRTVLSPYEKQFLLAFLYDLCRADDDIQHIEVTEIRKIGALIGLPELRIRQIEAQFIRVKAKEVNPQAELLNALAVFNLDLNASTSDIKKAYRSEIKEHHPDKVQHLGEEHVKIAEDYFKKIQDAYAIIKKHRTDV